MNNIILCGFMGCGKSTIGKNAAKKTGRHFIDMDEYIEKQAGKTVAEIFAESGEDGFRKLEHEACIELSKKRNLIVATGGGALTFERNVEVFRGTDTIVLLDVPLRIIRLRLRNDKKRPLLQRPDRDRVITELYHSRMPKYLAAADIVVKGESTPMKTTNSLIEALNLK